MDEDQQGIQFYQALVAHGMLEENSKEGQGVAPGMEHDEYTDADYEFDETNEDKGDDSNTEEEDPSDPPAGEAPQDSPVPARNPTGRALTPEEEIVALWQQVYATEAQAVLAEQERDEVIREMTEMTQLLAQQFGI